MGWSRYNGIIITVIIEYININIKMHTNISSYSLQYTRESNPIWNARNAVHCLPQRVNYKCK
jgi:hypothetical protein